MAPVLIGSCQLRPDQEWTAGAQAVRDVVNQRHGAACISVDMTIASAFGKVYSWFRHPGETQSSAASVQWPCVAYELTALPSSNNALGPLHVHAGAAAGAPWNVRMGAYIELLDEALNPLASSNPLAAPLGSWQLMRPEWDMDNNRVRIWLWNAGTSVWDLYIDYDHGSTLGGGPWKFGWGWQNYKAGSLNCAGRVQDVLWLDDAGTWPKTKPATPWECYPSFPNANGTYSAWAGDHNDVDDWEAGGALDAAHISCVAGSVKESHNFPNGIAPGNRPIVGVAFAHDSGNTKFLILADGAEESVVRENTFPPWSIIRPRTPAGNLWTPPLVDGMEYGVESLGATEVDATHICVAECELEVLAFRRQRGAFTG